MPDWTLLFSPTIAFFAISVAVGLFVFDLTNDPPKKAIKGMALGVLIIGLYATQIQQILIDVSFNGIEII